MTGVWYLDLDLDMVTGLWYINDPNFCSPSWFWRCKEHPCPLSPNLGLLGMLEVTVWGLTSWSWFEYGHQYLIHPWSKFWLSILILMVQRTYMSYKSFLGLWRTLEVPDWCLTFWSWFGHGNWSWIITILNIGSLSWFWRCKNHPYPLSPNMGLWRMLEIPH